MDKSRRTVLFGLGTTGLAAGTFFGSGAFTTLEAEREFTVEVAGDADAVVQLIPNEDLDGVSDTGGESGEAFEVALDEINVESVLSLGNPDDPNANEAFTIVNNTDGEEVEFTDGFDIDLTVETTLDPEIVQFLVDDPTDGTEDLMDTTRTLSPGEELAVAIQVDVGTEDIGDDEEPEITILAERATA